jgi:hypothetical protein
MSCDIKECTARDTWQFSNSRSPVQPRKSGECRSGLHGRNSARCWARLSCASRLWPSVGCLTYARHAFASPDVHPTATGAPATSVDVYPTLAELDSIENYIYGLQPFNPASLNDVVVGVFAYEYRPGASTAHGFMRISCSPAPGSHESAPAARRGMARGADFAAIQPVNRELP